MKALKIKKFEASDFKYFCVLVISSHFRQFSRIPRKTILHSNSDTINQYFCYFLSDITQTQDSFTTVLKLYANSKELTSVKLHAEHEFDKLNSNDGVGNDGKVKRQIHAIQDLMCVCDQKLEEIRLGGGSNFHNLGQAGSRASLFKDELIETKELKLKQLFKYLHLQGRTKDVDMMKFNMEAASLKEILFSREDNGREENGSLKMPDFDKKLGNEEKKRLTIIFQFFDRECDSYRVVLQKCHENGRKRLEKG